MVRWQRRGFRWREVLEWEVRDREVSVFLRSDTEDETDTANEWNETSVK